jgi:two-component system OmpR family response regulator
LDKLRGKSGRTLFLIRETDVKSYPNRGAVPMRTLVVEDDLNIASFIIKGLKQGGFAVDHAADGEDGLHLALTEPYDAAIIDIMLPKLDGVRLIEELRRRKVNTPVLILSAKRSVDDRVKGLQSGSDDYLTKPFAFSELLARVQALIRRASGSAEPTCLTVGDLSVDLLKREVVRAGKQVELQPREFALLILAGTMLVLTLRTEPRSRKTTKEMK